MRNNTPNLTDHAVLHQARTQLEKHLPLRADGYLCTTHDLVNLLLGAAATKDTLESVCRDLTQAPNAATLRSYLNEQLRVEDLPATLAAGEPGAGGRDPSARLVCSARHCH